MYSKRIKFGVRKTKKRDNEIVPLWTPKFRIFTTLAYGHIYVEITEEPARNGHKFQKESSNRKSRPILGASNGAYKSFPTIKVVGYKGKATVVVSCVTSDEPYRQHPNKLVGENGCKNGVCIMEIPTETMTIQFSHLRIQRVKKKWIESSLRLREQMRVDPFLCGFDHEKGLSSFDLTTVRLCFHVYVGKDLNESSEDKCGIFLEPKVSQPIHSSKNMISQPFIAKLSESTYPLNADKELILLCDEVAEKDIEIRFYEEINGIILWEDYAEFSPSHVHHRTAISFKPPNYYKSNLTDCAEVFIQLVRPSDGAMSASLPFQFLPAEVEKSERESLEDSFESNMIDSWVLDLQQDIPVELSSSEYNKLPSCIGDMRPKSTIISEPDTETSSFNGDLIYSSIYAFFPFETTNNDSPSVDFCHDETYDSIENCNECTEAKQAHFNCFVKFLNKQSVEYEKHSHLNAKPSDTYESYLMKTSRPHCEKNELEENEMKLIEEKINNFWKSELEHIMT